MTDPLSRREREILDLLYRLKEASAKEVQAAMDEPPSYSAVRALLRVMGEKGLVKHHQDGARYVYRAAQSTAKAKRNAVRRVLDVFFDNSVEEAVATLLEVSDSRLDDQELKRIKALIRQAKENE
ncbi:MAG: BlaI/MecI/CopY family transcriptional regulator [Myxococcota bacterium]